MTAFYDELSLNGAVDELTRIADFMECACEKAGVAPAARFDLQLAAEEACANVIEHAYCGLGGQFRICFEVRNGDVIVTLQDQGSPFNPEDVAPPDLSVPLSKRPIGGLGLHLMRRLMDQVRFEFSPETGNTLTMVKRGVAPGSNTLRSRRRRASSAKPPKIPDTMGGQV